MSGLNDSARGEIRSCIVGYLSALALTVVAFAIVHWHIVASVTTLTLVFALAFVQMVVHFYFFLDISFRNQSRDTLLLLVFSSLIVILMVSGTLVVIFNLRMRMM